MRALGRLLFVPMVVGCGLLLASCAPDPAALGARPEAERTGMGPAGDGGFAGPAAIGATVPDVALRTQDDDVVRLGDYRGQVVLVNFIFTRCPLPQFCPRLMQTFDAFRTDLARRPDLAPLVQLLSVTIDPAFDSPEVLRAYGTRMISGRDRFARWALATGTPAEIRRLSQFVGLVVQPSSGTIEHSTDIAVLDTTGRLVKRYPDMSFDPVDAMQIVVREAQRVAARGAVSEGAER